MDNASLCLPMLILFIQNFPGAPVSVYTEIPLVEVQEGRDAVLSCEFKTEKELYPRIEWKRRGIGKSVSFVYFDGQFKGELARRATISGATVTLRQVVQSDAGQYRCEISAPSDATTLGETNITLIVLVPPHTPSCDIPSSALTGSAVRLRCRDNHSIPPATYSWYKNNVPLRMGGYGNSSFTIDPREGVLEFRSVSRADTGRYSCESANKVGKAKRCEAQHMAIDDVNIPVLVAVVVVVCLLLTVCGCGGYIAHRNGFFSKDKGRSFWIPQGHGGSHSNRQHLARTQDNTSAAYSPSPQNPQDFKHTKSFML